MDELLTSAYWIHQIGPMIHGVLLYGIGFYFGHRSNRSAKIVHKVELVQREADIAAVLSVQNTRRRRVNADNL